MGLLFSFSGAFYTLYIFMALAATEVFYFRPKTEKLKKLAVVMRSAHGARE